MSKDSNVFRVEKEDSSSLYAVVQYKTVDNVDSRIEWSKHPRGEAISNAKALNKLFKY